jgi:hypothetical protein
MRAAPKAAHRLTRILDAYAAGGGMTRFPVDVRGLALGCAEMFKWPDPITEVRAARIPRFEGALIPSDARDRWLLLYNSAIRSPGRIRFTQAHELGHYILHRSLRNSFECTESDMLNWSLADQDMEGEADEFASYLLMPLNDFRQQATGGRVDLDLMGHCADRYGVSLTAAILKWLSYTDELAIVIMSNDGFMKWAWPSEPAFRAGAFFRTRAAPVPVPADSLTADERVARVQTGEDVPATVWFAHADPNLHVREMKLYSEHYESVITLLVIPRGASLWRDRRAQEEAGGH